MEGDALSSGQTLDQMDARIRFHRTTHLSNLKGKAAPPLQGQRSKEIQRDPKRSKRGRDKRSVFKGGLHLSSLEEAEISAPFRAVAVASSLRDRLKGFPASAFVGETDQVLELCF